MKVKMSVVKSAGKSLRKIGIEINVLYVAH